MRTSAIVTLPTADFEYGIENEQIMRRAVEHAFEDLRSDVIDSRDMTDKTASLSQRRAQFLLMGA